MSEPSGFYLRVKVDEHALRSFLRGPVAAPGGWQDWSAISGSWTAFSWDRQGKDLLDAVHSPLADRTAGEAWAGFLDGHHDCSAFRWNRDTGELRALNVFFAENLTDFLALAIVCLSLTEGAGARVEGGLIVRDLFWSEAGPLGSCFAMLFDGRRSRFARFDDESDAARVRALENEADTFARAMFDAGVGEVMDGQESPAVADLRAFMRGRND